MTYAVTISGSPSAASRSARLLRFVESELVQSGIEVRRIDVRALSPAALLAADTSHDDLRHALAQVAGAQAVVVATPVYKAAYSGLLKAFLDVLPQDGLADKLIAPFATGGSPAHLLALDYALKPVLSALGAQHILRGVFAVDHQVPKEEGGNARCGCGRSPGGDGRPTLPVVARARSDPPVADQGCRRGSCST